MFSLCSLALPTGHECTHIILCPCKIDVGAGFYNTNFNFKILWIIKQVYLSSPKNILGIQRSVAVTWSQPGLGATQAVCRKTSSQKVIQLPVL
jgi:hypothetical protein